MSTKVYPLILKVRLDAQRTLRKKSLHCFNKILADVKETSSRRAIAMHLIRLLSFFQLLGSNREKEMSTFLKFKIASFIIHL